MHLDKLGYALAMDLEMQRSYGKGGNGLEMLLLEPIQ